MLPAEGLAALEFGEVEEERTLGIDGVPVEAME